MWEPKSEVKKQKEGMWEPESELIKQKEGMWEPESEVKKTEGRDVGTRIGS